MRNHGGGYHNHNLFWKVLAPGGATSPGGELGSAVTSGFGSFDDTGRIDNIRIWGRSVETRPLPPFPPPPAKP